MMGNLGNGDISTMEASGKRQLERVVGDAPTLKFKRRKVSANREFPQGCGRYAPRLNKKTRKETIDVRPIENLESKTAALEETICVKPLGSSVESGTRDVDESSVIESLQLSKPLRPETSKSLGSLDKADAGEQVKIAESPKVVDEIEVVNPSKTFEPENSDLSKKELLDSMKNSNVPVPTGLLSAHLEGKELLKVESPIDTVSSDFPVRVKLSDHSQMLPIVETVERNMHQKYPPRRRISACRDFPKDCGRNAPRIMGEGKKSLVSPIDKISDGLVTEKCQESVVSSEGRSLVNEKEHTVGGGTKKTLEKEEFQDSVRERSLVNEKEQTVGGDTKQMIENEKCNQTVMPSMERILVKEKEQRVGEQPREKNQDGDAPQSKLKGTVRKEVEEEVRLKSEGRSKKETIEHKNVRVPSESKLKREDTIKNSNKPPRESDLSSPDLKSPPSSKMVVREVKSSGEKLGKEPAKLHRDASLKRKITGKSADKSDAVNQSQGQTVVDLRSLNERVVVQCLMAAANCPWRQGKRLFKSPSSLTHVSSRSKGKKQELMVKDNSKSISKKKKDETGASKGKSMTKKMSPTRELANEDGSQLILRDEDHSTEEDTNDEGNCSSVKKSKERVLTLIPLGLHSLTDNDDGSEAVVTRKKVKETLRLFQAIYRKLMQEEEAKSKKGQTSIRFDLLASSILKEKNRWVNTGKPIVGDVPGVEVGDEFHYRVELAIIGMHHPFQSGIDYLSGKNLATSIVASGGYGDETDSSDVLKYSGQGGKPSGADKKVEDQKLVRGNLALKNSMDQKSPVRVIRGFKEKSSDSLNAKARVSATYIYDGLYLVERYWQETGRYGANVYMFELRRIPGQPELAFKEVKKSKKAKAREGLCLADISQGKEKMPICAINTIDNEKPPPFTYITNMIYPPSYNLTPPRGCDCTDGCSDSDKCLCAVKNGGEIPYNYDGAIVQAKDLVYECGPSCKCRRSCHNRVSQHGIKFQLEIFKTESRGWGVRSLNSIPSGSFICEYTGELLEDKEAEKRSNDEYLFDIGNNYNDPLEGLSTVMPSDLKTSSSCETMEDGGFTIDAAMYGSIGRFINHSCSPNLYAQNVVYDHEDERMPHIMLFAADNIPPLQELTYHYNYQLDQVRDSDGNIKKKSCYCGAVDCTGRMY